MKLPTNGAMIAGSVRDSRNAQVLHSLPPVMRPRTTLVHWGEPALTERLEKAEDIFFITLSEARVALDGTDMHSIVREPGQQITVDGSNGRGSLEK